LIENFNLNLALLIFFSFSGILASVIAYTDTLYNSNSNIKFFLIKIGFIFTLYILLESIILYFLGIYRWVIPVSVFILTLISYFQFPDFFLYLKIKLPKFIILLLYFWSFFVYWILLGIITEETKIFSSYNFEYTFLLSIVLLLIHSIITIFYVENIND
jgi:hypothetical protein